jgi:predicted amidophosphoribosyltransferase
MSKNITICLDGKIPIRVINKPYCQRCMNALVEGQRFCDICVNPPFDGDNWYFNEVKALGIYHNYKTSDYQIPINNLTELVNILKFRQHNKFKKYAGELIADGLFQLTQTYPKLIEDTTYITIIPKFNTTEVNQCDFILKPLMTKFSESGSEIQDISSTVVRIMDIGEHKYKNLNERYDGIKGIHRVDISNLEMNKILILDDILTTGSTVWDLARALKEKNAGEINIIVAGRHYQYEKWPIAMGMEFDNLLLYFSDLDLHREKKKIDKVCIKSLSVSENKQISSIIKGTKKEYRLIIDFEKKILNHNCTDFLMDRKWKKRFCKHITKVFLQMKEDYGLDYSQNLLELIYQQLDKWIFENVI